MANETSKILIAALLVGGVIGGVAYQQHQEKERRIEGIIKTETVHALEQAWTQTLEYRNTELQSWNQRLNTSLEKRFLPWYYSFFTRQVMDIRAVGCKIASVVTDCDPAEDMQNQVMESFQRYVLKSAGRPQEETAKLVEKYTSTIAEQINQIPSQHPEVSPERLQGFLSQSVVRLPGGDSGAEVSKTLATLVSDTFNDDALAQNMVKDVLKNGLEEATTHVTTKLAERAFGTSAKYVLGPIVKAGFLAWEYYDLKQEEAEQKETMRSKLSGAFSGMETNVSEDAERIMQKIETGILRALPEGQTLQVAHAGPALELASEPATESVETPREPASTPVHTDVVTAQASQRPSEMPYSLQVASRESYEDARQLADALPNGDVLEKKINGKIWYAVLSGGFASKEAALAHKQYLLSNYAHVGSSDDIPEAFVRTRPDLQA